MVYLKLPAGPAIAKFLNIFSKNSLNKRFPLAIQLDPANLPWVSLSFPLASGLAL